MMVTQRYRQTREIRGLDPNSVAIIARNPVRHQPDKLLMERRMREDQLVAAQELSKLTKMQNMRSDWEKSTDRKLQANAVRRRVQGLLHDTKFTLEARRQRLRDLLESENAQLMEEAALTQETSLDRQSRLRERAKLLRERREADRMTFVEKKYEQQFREQCEELRNNVSRQQRSEIVSDLQDQVRIKEEQELERRQEEILFSQMLMADIEAKTKREENDIRRQYEANRQTEAFLREQIAAVEQKKQQEKRLNDERALLIQADEELKRIEERKVAEEKRRTQLEWKSALDQTLKAKRSVEARQAQEELAFDRKLLEELLKQSRLEESEHEQRKREIKEESRRYREYLKELKAEELRREQEIDKICSVETEKMWEKKVIQWKIEATARQKLLEDVMNSRRQQIQEKMAANMVRRKQAEQERQDLADLLAENKRLDFEARNKTRQDIIARRSDLVGQMDYNRRQKINALDETKRRELKQQEAEVEYQRKVEYLLHKPVLEKIHPLRRQLYSSAGPEQQRMPILRNTHSAHHVTTIG